MKEFKGTKGEWKMKVFSQDNKINVHSETFGAICEMPINQHQIEFESNAKLIAAAPELLNELQRARMMLFQHGFTDKSSTIISIDKAINKALGE